MDESQLAPLSPRNVSLDTPTQGGPTIRGFIIAIIIFTGISGVLLGFCFRFYQDWQAARADAHTYLSSPVCTSIADNNCRVELPARISYYYLPPSSTEGGKGSPEKEVEAADNQGTLGRIDFFTGPAFSPYIGQPVTAIFWRHTLVAVSDAAGETTYGYTSPTFTARNDMLGVIVIGSFASVSLLSTIGLVVGLLTTLHKRALSRRNCSL